MNTVSCHRMLNLLNLLDLLLITVHFERSEKSRVMAAWQYSDGFAAPIVTRNQAPAWLRFYVAKLGLSYKSKKLHPYKHNLVQNAEYNLDFILFTAF